MKRILIGTFIILLFSSIAQAEPSKKNIKFIQKANMKLIHLYQSGKYTEALEMGKMVTFYAKRFLGKDHPGTISSVINLATVYKAQGQYALAEPLFKRVLETRERLLGKEHPGTIDSIDSLADLYYGQGRYAQAEPLHKRALETSERVLGKEHQDTLSRINNLALVYKKQGQYNLAEPLYKRTLETRERILGKEHPRTLTSISNLASLYLTQGRYKLAETLNKRALKTSERILGKEHPDTLTSINNLAVLYIRQRRYALAEPLLKRTLEIKERLLGQEHPDTSTSANNLALLYYRQGRLALAAPLFKQALKTSMRILGKEHPDILPLANNLASLYHEQGQYDQAESLLKQSLVISERILGKVHQNTLRLANNLAFLHYDQQRWQQATILFDRATSGYAYRTERIGVNSLTGQKKTESQRNIIEFQIYLKAAFRASTTQPERKVSFASTAFSRLQWAQNTEASAALSQMAVRVGAGNGRLAALVRERQDHVQDWKKLDSFLGKAAGLPPQQRNTALEQKLRIKMQQTEKRIRVIDAIFTQEFPDYTSLINPRPLSVKQTQNQLHPDEALVYIVDTPKWRKTEEETFIWVITRTDMKWVRSPIGTTALTKMVRALRCGLDHSSWSDPQSATQCNQLLDTNLKYQDLKSGKTLPFNKDISYQLYEGLFGQVKKMIEGKKLLLVPSGPLTSLPFQVLLKEKPSAFVHYSDLKWLISEHDLTVLPSVSSLKALRRTSKRSNATNPFFGMGNPLLTGPSGNDKRAWSKQKCDFDSQKPVKFAAWDARKGIAGFFRGGQADISLLKRQYPLPETADELCAVAKALDAKTGDIRLGAKATEANIKKLSSDGILKNAKIIHFATHGLLSGETKSLIKDKAEPSLMLTPPDAATGIDDGLLTASEITQLKLDADWVILSACNTAAGDKPGAEPMSGLAKAFFYAGARALLVSHWAVDSGATVKLITNSKPENRPCRSTKGCNT